MSAREPKPDHTLDLLGVPCPRNAMLATLQLDGMDEGEVLELWVSDGEAIEVFVPGLAEEGYEVLHKGRREAGGWRVLVRA